MSIPIDDEAYGKRSSQAPDEVRQGNPGRAQSEFDEGKEGDEPRHGDQGHPDHPTGETQAAENIENEPAG